MDPDLKILSIMFAWCLRNQTSVHACHLRGVWNVRADTVSRPLDTQNNTCGKAFPPNQIEYPRLSASFSYAYIQTGYSTPRENLSVSWYELVLTAGGHQPWWPRRRLDVVSKFCIVYFPHKQRAMKHTNITPMITGKHTSIFFAVGRNPQGVAPRLAPRVVVVT
eukprot:SAG31_NODE_4620_length_3090_cov_5.096958_4_plen_164_part_00